MDCKFYEKIEYDMPASLDSNDPSTSTLESADGASEFGKCVLDGQAIANYTIYVVVGIAVIVAIVVLVRMMVRKKK